MILDYWTKFFLLLLNNYLSILRWLTIINSNKEQMTKPIININEVVEIYFESGSARTRFKEGVTLEPFFNKKLQNGNASTGFRENNTN